ncbi:MAG: hypothetical protein JXR10_08215 [Cyclobacteriaceae bacterium]
MRNTLKSLALLLLIFGLLSPAISRSTGEEKEVFEQLSTKLETAIEGRNFHDAREAIEELMPLMKDELKRNKKELSLLKKAEEPEIEPSVFEKNLVRKTELYNSLKDLVGVSPAALRVKSEKIKKDVEEFIELS